MKSQAIGILPEPDRSSPQKIPKRLRRLSSLYCYQFSSQLVSRPPLRAESVPHRSVFVQLLGVITSSILNRFCWFEVHSNRHDSKCVCVLYDPIQPSFSKDYLGLPLATCQCASHKTRGSICSLHCCQYFLNISQIFQQILAGQGESCHRHSICERHSYGIRNTCQYVIRSNTRIKTY